MFNNFCVRPAHTILVGPAPTILVQTARAILVYPDCHAIINQLLVIAIGSGMVAPNEKLAQSLTSLRRLQEGGRGVYRSADFSREDRERLVRHGWLMPIVKGWLMASEPGVRKHDSTPWHAAFWEFCSRYCAHRFGSRWHLSPELSLMLHAEKSTVPHQVIVHAAEAGNHRIDLPFETSLFNLKSSRAPAPDDLCIKDDLHLFTVEAALLRVPERFYQDHPVEAKTVLASVSQITGLVRRLLEGSHSKVAGRLAGAFRHIERERFADEILRAMRDTEHDVRESNPFSLGDGRAAIAPGSIRGYTSPPITHRIRTLWDLARNPILDAFPAPPGLPVDADAKKRFLKQVHEIYVTDAYHSLSIEGYRVTKELIDQVRAGDWDPEHVPEDRGRHDTLAARGYWQTFLAVQQSIGDILNGANAGEIFRTDHGRWFFQLFEPFVVVGVYGASGLGGYRNQPVYLQGSRHVPPRYEVVPDAMDTLFALLEEESHPAVRAVAGHWLFGHIHPHRDGNGRIGRFLMNVMLASGGYPWTVIRVEDREKYLVALESASVDQDFEPFAEFLARKVGENMPSVSVDVGAHMGPSP